MARSSGPPASSDGSQPLPVSSPVGLPPPEVSLHRLFPPQGARRCDAVSSGGASRTTGSARRGSSAARLSLSAWVMVSGSLGGIGASIRISNSNPSLQPQPVDRHQQRVVPERHLRRRQRGGRGMAEEIEDLPVGHVLVQHHRRLSARPQRPQEGRDAVARARIGPPADPFDRLHVMGVDVRVVERPVEPADVIAALVQRRARRLPVAEMGRDEDDRRLRLARRLDGGPAGARGCRTATSRS
jgi:hypothetical protein